jgi:hypothetical protein
MERLLNCVKISMNIPFFLPHGAVNANGRKVTFAKELVQLARAVHRFHKYTNLIEFECIK